MPSWTACQVPTVGLGAWRSSSSCNAPIASRSVYAWHELGVSEQRSSCRPGKGIREHYYDLPVAWLRTGVRCCHIPPAPLENVTRSADIPRVEIQQPESPASTRQVLRLLQLESLSRIISVGGGRTCTRKSHGKREAMSTDPELALVLPELC